MTAFSRARNLIGPLLFRSGKVKNTGAKIKQKLVSQRLRKYLAQGYVPNQNPMRKDVVVSLTSWAPRFAILPHALVTLLEQSIRPLRIDLWLTASDLEKLPVPVRNLFDNSGIQFRTSLDFGPHKKWLNPVMEREEKFFVTADDDILFPHHWLQALLEDFSPADRVAVAHRCHQIIRDEKGEVAEYERWPKEINDFGRKSFSLFATGGSGQLLHHSWFLPKYLDTAKIMELCPAADDIWINCALRHADVPVRRTHSYFPLFEAASAYETALLRANVHTRQNDRQLRAVMQFFGLDPSIFFREST
jgi:hypothetical protein